MILTGQFGIDWLTSQLATVPITRDWVVAFSGGGDSQALLHAISHGAHRGHKVRAVHIHHGLQEEAESWVLACGARCAEWGIEYSVIRVNATARNGDSPEERARELRYAALKKQIQPGDVLLTAHHADDQAETLLLQLLRGSGPAGLSAMPACVPFAEGLHVRPMLGVTRSQLREYLKIQGVDYIEDPSNNDLSPARNYLRHQVLPLIKDRWPGVVNTLNRSARWQAECQELMNALGDEDLKRVSGEHPGTLVVSAICGLSDIRMRNVIRVWLRALKLPLPNERRLSNLEQLLTGRNDSQASIQWAGGEIRRYRNELYAGPSLAPHDPKLIIEWDLKSSLFFDGCSEPLTPDMLLSDVEDLRRAGFYTTIRFRRGGERCRIHPHGARRELKSLFQEASVPPWLRDRVPLLYVGDQLAEVIGYWVCHH